MSHLKTPKIIDLVYSFLLKLYQRGISVLKIYPPTFRLVVLLKSVKYTLLISVWKIIFKSIGTFKWNWHKTTSAPDWKCASKVSPVFSANNKTFLRRFVTTDQTWVHYYTTVTKQQSKQWKHAESPPPNKAKQYGLSERSGLILLECER